MQISVKQNQSVIDIALEHCGSVEAVPSICQLNSISINETLVTGSILEVPEVINETIKSQVVNLSTQQ